MSRRKADISSFERRLVLDQVRQAPRAASRRPIMRPEDEMGVLWDWSRGSDRRSDHLVLDRQRQPEDA